MLSRKMLGDRLLGLLLLGEWLGISRLVVSKFFRVFHHLFVSVFLLFLFCFFFFILLFKLSFSQPMSFPTLTYSPRTCFCFCLR